MAIVAAMCQRILTCMGVITVLIPPGLISALQTFTSGNNDREINCRAGKISPPPTEEQVKAL